LDLLVSESASSDGIFYIYLQLSFLNLLQQLTLGGSHKCDIIGKLSLAGLQHHASLMFGDCIDFSAVTLLLECKPALLLWTELMELAMKCLESLL
jgi:hypothetical protein